MENSNHLISADNEVLLGDVLTNGIPAIRKYDLTDVINTFAAKGPEWGDRLLSIAESDRKLCLDIQVKMAKLTSEVVGDADEKSKRLLDTANECIQREYELLHEKWDVMSESERNSHENTIKSFIQVMTEHIEEDKEFKEGMVQMQYDASKEILEKNNNGSALREYEKAFWTGVGIGSVLGFAYWITNRKK